jgi:hypothetical protein
MLKKETKRDANLFAGEEFRDLHLGAFLIVQKN